MSSLAAAVGTLLLWCANDAARTAPGTGSAGAQDVQGLLCMDHVKQRSSAYVCGKLVQGAHVPLVAVHARGS